MIKLFIKNHFELLFWVAAIWALALSNPGSKAHFTLCPLKLAGAAWCPGCGIGHAISWLLHGDIAKSFHAHWFGVPALGIILFRIYSLSPLRDLCS